MDEQVESNRVSRGSLDEIDLKGLVLAIWRGKWLIAIAGCLGFVLGGYYAFVFAKVTYSTAATVVQEVDQEPVVDFNAALSGGSFGGGADQSSINTEIEVIRSRELMELLVADLDLLSDPEFNVEIAGEPAFSLKETINSMMRLIGISIAQEQELTEQQILDAVVDRILDKLIVTNLRLTYVFEISMSSSSALKSAEIVNTLADIYIANQLDVKSRANRRDIDWLTERVRELQSELEVAEVAVKDFNAATDLINEETLAALNRQVKELRDRLQEEREREAELNARVAALNDARPDFASMVAIAADREIRRIYDAEIANSDPDWTNFENAYQLLSDRAQIELERLRRQIAALELSVLQQEEAADQQSSDLLRLQQLQREATASGILYEFFLSRLKEASVQSGIQEPESRVLSRAVVPVDPSAPRRVLILATFILFGSIAGLLFVVVRELRSSTFRTADTLETHTGLPVVGQLPTTLRRRLSANLTLGQKRTASPFATALRNLRASLLLADPQKLEKVFLITSSISNEGKTSLAAMLTQSISRAGQSVLLIEANLRSPTLAKQLKIDGPLDLSSVADTTIHFDDIILTGKIGGADVVVAAKDKVEAIDFLSGPRFAKFMEEMRDRYDVVILDGPAVSVAPDSGLLGRYADVVLYLVKWNLTSRQDVSAGLRTFSSFSQISPKLVLTQVNRRLQKRFGTKA